jgi:hypothetical protein
MLDPEHRVPKIWKPVATPSTAVVPTENLKMPNQKFLLVTKNHKKINEHVKLFSSMAGLVL